MVLSGGVGYTPPAATGELRIDILQADAHFHCQSPVSNTSASLR